MSDMTRKEVIDWLCRLRSWIAIYIPRNKQECKQALDFAIKSLETDEAYQLEYESTTKKSCVEQNGCISCSLDDGDDCCRKLYEDSMQESITKNDLGVDAISRAEIFDSAIVSDIDETIMLFK